jgi:hypothetical protein
MVWRQLIDVAQENGKQRFLGSLKLPFINCSKVNGKA